MANLKKLDLLLALALGKEKMAESTLKSSKTPQNKSFCQ